MSAPVDETLEAAIRTHAAGGYAIADVRFARCTCDGLTFRLHVDDDVGAAVRTCAACKTETLMLDSPEDLADVTLEACECPCGKDVFALGVGFARTSDARDLRWVSFGLRCIACNQAAVYADWKIDYSPSLPLLNQV